MRFIAKPKPLFECKDRRRESDFQCSIQRRKPDGLEGIWNRTSPQVVQVPDLVKCVGDTADRMPDARFIKVK